jgi:uncharacterized protein YjbI with pentapeptide repeats
MSDTSGTCTYQARKEEPETWHGEDPDKWYVGPSVETGYEVWDCPHQALDGHDRCVFHLPPEEVPDDVDESEHFVKAINEESVAANGERARRKRQFVGATFGELRVKGILITDNDHPIILDHIRVEGTTNFNGTTFDARVNLWGATFHSKTFFRNTVFNARVSFIDATINAGTNFGKATFNAETSIEHTTINAEAHFRNVTFNAGIDFRGTSFDRVNFQNATFNSWTIFSEMTNFKSEADFQYSTFNARTYFEDAIFDAEADFKYATFDKVDFSGVMFKAEADFLDLDLTGVDFAEATLTNANLENTLLNRATLAGADLRGAALAGAVLGDARIDGNTRFLGTPDQENEPVDDEPSDQEGESADEVPLNQENESADEELSLVGGYCVYDYRYDSESNKNSNSDSAFAQAMDLLSFDWIGFGTENTNPDENLDSAQSIYRALETLAGANARPQLQSRCFVNRQDIQLERYRRRMKSASSFQRKMEFGGRWLRARVSRVIFLYGESPWRVTGWSFASILVFAFLYPLGGWMYNTQEKIVTYASGPFPSVLGNSFYFSTVTFTSLGYGDFQPYGFGRSLATVETALGAVLIALLVFVLGRRAAR